MKTTETPAPPPAEPGASVSKVDAPVSKPGRRKKEGTVLNVFSHGVLVIWAIMVVTPLLWAVMTSFKDDGSIFGSPWALPDRLHFGNWARAWTEANMSGYFLNTVLVVGGSLIGTL
ncbi:carbohydrate ABC transporter permease, partial [Streptomyces sp. SID6139]|nr:carbohydrate ABC transporter permease [Streptomyces sp. SID6139]